MEGAAPEISSLSQFVARLERQKLVASRISLYRGHADADFTLVPALFREKENRKDEKNILRELLSMHPNEFLGDRSLLDQLVRMQHYGLPTRLLDLTFNPLVGLFFVCNSDEHKDKDGQLIRFTISKRKLRYFDSDTVSCIANLANLSGRERDAIRRMKLDQELIEEGSVGRRLLHFIKSEKSYFEPRIKLDDLKSIVPVKPRLSNRRVIAQHGGFFLFGLTTELKNENDFGIKIYRNVVRGRNKKKILRELDRININRSTLFPEIESAAKYIMERITPASGSEVG